MFAKRWREHDDRERRTTLSPAISGSCQDRHGLSAATDLPISEVVSEGNVGLMQAVKRFEPEKGFRLATYAMCGSRRQYKSTSCVRGRS